MTNNIQLEVQARTDIGKGASRRLRHTDQVPGIIYGAQKEPLPITIVHKNINKALENEEFYTQIITLKLGDQTEKVVLKALQRHVYKPKILHVDFLRIKADEEISMQIPLHFTGEKEAPGAKQGGIFSHLISEVEIKCLPKDLPKFIEVDAAKMELNSTIHMSDIILPKNVKFTVAILDEEHDQPIVSLHLPRTVEEVAPAEEVAIEEKAASAEATEKASNKTKE